MDFIILKINGEDLTSASHSDVIKAFNCASEPIIVEVARRHRPACSNSVNRIADSASNVHNDRIDPYASTDLCCDSPRLSYDCSTATRRSAHKIEGILEEEDHPGSVVTEEVTLRKVHTRQIFGLTLCYNAKTALDSSESQVFISAIEPGSVAGQQSGLRVGDQILQINGVHAHSKSQVVSIFQGCSLEVRMLVARPTLAAKKNSFTNNICALKEAEYSSVYDDLEDCEGRSLYHAQMDKDSGIGRGSADASKTGESSEYESSQTSLRHSSKFSSLGSEQSGVDLSQVSLLMEHLALEYQHLHKLLLTPTLPELPLRVVPRMGTKSEQAPLKVAASAPSTASGRISGTSHMDSARNPPPAAELGPTLDTMLSLKLRHSSHGRSPHSLDEDGCFLCSTTRPVAAEIQTSRLTNRVTSTEHTIPDNESNYYDVYDLSMITKAVNGGLGADNSSQSSPLNADEPSYGEHRMEWVVKKRPDGTRFITRRPRRNKMLKDLARKVLGGSRGEEEVVSENQNTPKEMTFGRRECGHSLSLRGEVNPVQLGAPRAVCLVDLRTSSAGTSFPIGSTLF